MTNDALNMALEAIYTSVNSDNKDLGAHIARLKAALGEKKDVTVDPARLVHNNRQGRKILQAYFKKRGVLVTFA